MESNDSLYVVKHADRFGFKHKYYREQRLIECYSEIAIDSKIVN
jgi:hypothetical protein